MPEGMAYERASLLKQAEELMQLARVEIGRGIKARARRVARCSL
jgi:hypothetical protein